MMFSWSVRVHACVDRSKHPNRENCYIWAMLINRWCCSCGLTSLSSLPHPLPTSSVHLTGRPAVWRPPPHAQGRGAGSPTPSPSFRRSTYMCGRGCNFLRACSFFIPGLPIVPRLIWEVGSSFWCTALIWQSNWVHVCWFIESETGLHGGFLVVYVELVFHCHFLLSWTMFPFVMQVMENGEALFEKNTSRINMKGMCKQRIKWFNA